MVAAPDAHPIDGSFSFTVTAPVPEPPDPTPPDTQTDETAVAAEETGSNASETAGGTPQP